jgi:hypothetical protein
MAKHGQEIHEEGSQALTFLFSHNFEDLWGWPEGREPASEHGGNLHMMVPWTHRLLVSTYKSYILERRNETKTFQKSSLGAETGVSLLVILDQIL